MINVLFVCAGNICRSPMADAVFQQRIREAGLDGQIRVNSAGTGAWNVGDPPHPETRALLRENNIPYEGVARQIRYADLESFDYVLAMDRENLSDILRLLNRGERSAQQKLEHFYDDAKKPEIALFLSYANHAGTVEETEVPDPYYYGHYDLVYSLVDRGCTALLDHLRTRHRL